MYNKDIDELIKHEYRDEQEGFGAVFWVGVSFVVMAALVIFYFVKHIKQ